MLDEFKRIEQNCKTSIESLFYNVKTSVLAHEHWKLDLTTVEKGFKYCSPENEWILGNSVHVVICMGDVKKECEPMATTATLKKQLNRSIRKVVELFPNSENEILFWRAEPHVEFAEDDHNDRQKAYLRMRLSSMPKYARIVQPEEQAKSDGAYKEMSTEDFSKALKENLASEKGAQIVSKTKVA